MLVWNKQIFECIALRADVVYSNHTLKTKFGMKMSVMPKYLWIIK